MPADAHIVPNPVTPFSFAPQGTDSIFSTMARSPFFFSPPALAGMADNKINPAISAALTFISASSNLLFTIVSVELRTRVTIRLGTPEDWKAGEGLPVCPAILRYCFGLVAAVAVLDPVAGAVCVLPL